MTEKSDSSTEEQMVYSKHTDDFLKESSVSAITYVFMNPSSSRYRRIFWFLILLVSAGALLYVLYDRFNELAQQPTSTALSFYQDADQDFPAVTICSNNAVRRSTFTSENFNFVNNLLVITEPGCETVLSSQRPDGFNEGYQDMLLQRGHDLLDLVVECTLMGVSCDRSDAVITPTPQGICYTFNSGVNRDVFKARTTGAVSGLSLTIDVERDDYFIAVNEDAGVKVSIHPQGVPPRPDEQGISVGIGHKAFIGIRKVITVDESSFRNCSNGDETESWNFFQERSYSSSACVLDCLYTGISDQCGCNEFAGFFTPDADEYIARPQCTLDDVCCEVEQYNNPSLRDPQLCGCPLPCAFDSYEKTISYSTFPNDARAELFGDLGNSRFTADYVKSNFLSVDVFFETLTVEQRITSDDYTWPALVADVGGQLGLFLGFTALTLVELLMWIFDLIKNRNTCTVCCVKADGKNPGAVNPAIATHADGTYPAIEGKVNSEMTTFSNTLDP